MPARSPFTQLCQHLAQLRAEANRADLHIHTCHSDGHFTPEEVVRRAQQRGLGAIAITDHDTVAGFVSAAASAKSGDGPALEVVPGVEITCEYDSRELHLLGYFFRPADAALNRALRELQLRRQQRFAEMVQRLPDEARLEDDALRESRMTACAPSRHSLAVLLLQHGKVKTTGEAFARFLCDGGPVCVPKLRLPVAEGIALVRAAGGTTSWAHPPHDVTLERVLAFRAMGLNALEAVYPTFTATRSRHLRQLAEAAGLAISGGSDCHGPSPARRAIGTCGVTRPELQALRGTCAAV